MQLDERSVDRRPETRSLGQELHEVRVTCNEQAVLETRANRDSVCIDKHGHTHRWGGTFHCNATF